MRRRPTPPPMSLFPFLDTLVCTMGALILMLLAMTPKIKERAQARLEAQMAAQAPAVSAEPDPEPEPQAEPQPVPQPEPESVPEKVAVAPVPNRAQVEAEHAAERKRRREAWFKTAAEARDKLAARQGDYRRQRQLLKDADQRLKDLQDQILSSQLKAESVEKAEESLSAVAERLEAQQERVTQEIAKTRKNIDVLNRRQAESKNEYSLVPYDGTSGTVRRPIYIECTGKGFRFLPEDETVSPADLDGFPDNFNPLLTGTQALVRFWARRRRSSPQPEPEPYVLLVVRPSGCVNYYRARLYLSSLNVNFGYELIEEDWKLSVPDADPVAKSLLKETLDTTVQASRPARNAFADAGRGGFEDFGRGDRSNGFGSSRDDDNWGNSSRGSRNGLGNANGTGGGSGAGRKPGVRFGPATRAGRNGTGDAAGNSAHGDASGDPGTTNGTVTGAGATTGTGAGSSGMGTRGAKAAGMSGGKRPGAGTGSGNGIGTGTGTGSGDSDPNDSSELTLAVSRPGTGSGNSAASSTGSGGSSETGNLFGGTGQRGLTGRGGSGRSGSGRGNSARPATLGGNSSDPGEGEGDGSGDGSDPEELSLPSLAVSRSRSGAGSGSASAEGGLTEKDDAELGGTGTGPGEDRLSGTGFGPGSTTGSASRGSRSASPSGVLSRTSSASNSSNSSTGSPSAADAQGSGASSYGDPSSASGSAGGSSSSAQFGGPGATVSLGGKKKSKLIPKDDDPDDGPRITEDNGKTGGPMGRSRGPRQWGKAGNRATTGYERRIEIRLSANKILVGSKDVAVPVRNDDSAEDIVHRVVNAIEYVADKWGAPPEGFYWVPAVRFVVYPGGDAYSEKLSKVLEQRYSVNSTIEFADDKPAKKAASQGKP